MNPEYNYACFEIKQQKLPQFFAIITANNPKGITKTEAENKILHRTLQNDLRKNSLANFEITGMSPDKSHQEAGYGVSCSLEDAIALGQKYKQEAIFWVDQDSLNLIDLKDLSAHALGSFNARCKQ